MHWSILGELIDVMRSQLGSPAGLYWSLLGRQKATQVRRSRARCCTGLYWSLLGRHKATQMEFPVELPYWSALLRAGRMLAQ